MSLMEWNDTLSVGIKVVDDDHKKLIGLLNELHDAVASGHGKDVLGRTLDGLVSYTRFHFTREERMFEETGYADAVAHKKEHDDLTKQVLDVQARYKNDARAMLSLEVMSFLKNWLFHHIEGSDKKYAPHLKAKGIH